MSKLLLASFLLAVSGLSASAQKNKDLYEGTGYYLPRTDLRFTMQVEKTTYQPGEFALYAEKYLKIKNVSTQPSVEYRITGLSIVSEASRDTAKYYIAPADSKHNIQTIELDDNGVLLSINAEPKAIKKRESFSPAPKPTPLNPRDYMNEEILSAGSPAKMAELCALEIYDIRESKSLLNKGQADFMPKDGEQLRLMLSNLDMQERALMQLFEGVTLKDTTETDITFVPQGTTNRQMLFRFSRWMGITDIDDMGGFPYYISVEDEHFIPPVQDNLVSDKKPKDNIGIYVNMPGKIKITLFKGEEQWAAYELYAAQFGRTAMIDDDLFGKKTFTSLVLNPVTGNLESFKSESVKK